MACVDSCNRKSAVISLNIQINVISVNSTRFGDIANKTCFVTGCIDYHLSRLLWSYFSKYKHC